MVEATPAEICGCKIVKGKIVFCVLHANASTLLATCDYVRKFLSGLKAAEENDQNMIREIVLPYLNRQIAAAERKSG